MRADRSRSALAALCLSAVTAVMIAGAAGAQEETRARTTPPPPKPMKEIQFPPFQVKTLPNGLRLVAVEQHETPSVSLRLMVPAGKVFAPLEKAGLADATAELLREGTESRSSQQIAEAIDSVGGALITFTRLESAYGAVMVTSDQLDLALDLLSDVVLRPTFPAEELERWRQQRLSALQVQQADPDYLADAAFERALLGPHPYGQPGSGTPESVQALTREDLLAFHRRQYVPNEAILAIVGDIDPQQAFAKAEKAFGGWKKGAEASIPPVPEPQSKGHRVLVIDKPDAVQTSIRVGQTGPAYTDPAHFTARVYEAVVGAGSSSRLFQEIRDKRGLTYGAYADFVMPTRDGWFFTGTSTKTESTVETLDVILEVLEGMEKPVPPGELESRKGYLTGVFPLEIERPEGIAAKILEAMKFGYGKEFLETYRNRLQAVTPEQVQAFARQQIHPDRMLIVLVGNAAAFAGEVEKKYGKPEVIPFAEVDLLQPGLRRPGAAPEADGNDTEKPTGPNGDN